MAVVQAARVVAAYQPAKQVDTGLSPFRPFWRRQHKGVVKPCLPGQTCLRLVAATPAAAGNAASDMPRLHKVPERRTAPPTLVVVPSAVHGHKLTSLDQPVVVVGAMVRAVPATRAPLPHLAAVVAQRLLILYRPDRQSAAYTGAVHVKLAAP